MFGNNVATNSLTFGKVLNGISKTLSVANQVIPLYQQAKPMINNAKTIMNVFKNFTPKNKESIINTRNHYENKDTITKKIQKKNNPVFFQ